MAGKHLLIIILVLAALVIGAHMAIKKTPTEEQVTDISTYVRDMSWWQGKYPPDFEFTLLDTTQFKLSEYIGKKIIILNFFTTWCGPCKAELPELKVYYMKHQSDNVLIVGINADEKQEVVEKFVARQRINFPVGIDKDREIEQRYGVGSYPTTIFIGVDGKVGMFQLGSIANADVAFGSLLAAQKELLMSGKGIDRAVYQQMVEAQSLPPSVERREAKKPPKEYKPKTVLEGTAKNFAGRMRCPSCKKSLLECRCCFCESVQESLSKMNVTNKSDEQVLRELFLEGEKK